jgi:hypothetical protein
MGRYQRLRGCSWLALTSVCLLSVVLLSAVCLQFLALETNAEYTAYFHANDSREASHVVNGTQYGFPIQDALWRCASTA